MAPQPPAPAIKIDSATDDDFSNLKPISRHNSPRHNNGGSSKNLRFFGDTDMESNASISKGTGKQK